MRYLAFSALVAVATLVLAAPAGASDESWAERVDFSGDFRLRYESIEREGLSDRSRGRYRVRLNAGIALYDDVTFVLSLATAADNPISRNVTFGGNDTDDDFGVDTAYADWRPSESLNVYAGKMKNPMYQPGAAQLIIDNDLNPSGAAVRYQSGPWFAFGGVYQVQERTQGEGTLVYHLQGGAAWPLGDDTTLTVGGGYLEFTDVAGNVPFILGLPAGNTVDAAGRYVYDYANAELFAEFASTVRRLPVSVFAHVAENTEVEREDGAYAVGVSAGKAKNEGSWDAAWIYKTVEADAVVGSFTESDFAGGGSDAEGHVFRGRYMLRDRLSLTGTYYLTEANSSGSGAHDYRRLQLDVEFKFD